MFKEEDALKAIKDLLNYNDVNRIRQVLQSINPKVFGNEVLRDKFKEVLLDIYNIDNINHLKNLLNNFINECNKYGAVYHIGYISQKFIEKFKRKDFRGLTELKKFRDIILRIIRSKKEYPTEDIGEFFVSPRGHEKHRVVWFIKENIIYFCEPFHHDREYEEFCDKAKFKVIGKKDYAGWEPVEELGEIHLEAA